MKSIRNLWWVGAVALIAACDPYDDENKSPPSIISTFASNQSDVSEGELVNGVWTMRSSSVCAPAHLTDAGVVPRGDSVAAKTVGDIPVIFVKTNKLLDGSSIQTDWDDCTPAQRNGAPWITVTRVVGTTEETIANADGWFTCYNPSSPTSSEGASIIIYPGGNVSGGVEGDTWFGNSEVTGEAAQVTTYRIRGTALDKQGNELPIDLAFEVEPDAGPSKIFRATGISGTGSAVTASFVLTPDDCDSAATYVVQKATGEDADGETIWTDLQTLDAGPATFTFDDTGLTYGESYDYRVRTTVPGTGEEFTETAAEYTLTVLALPSAAPTVALLPASDVGTDDEKPNRVSVDYATAVPEGGDAYAVLRAAEDETIAATTPPTPGVFDVLEPAVKLTGTADDTLFPVEDEDLGGCQLYFYALATVDADGNMGPQGPAATVRTPPASADAPEFDTETLTATTVDLTWALVRGAVTYELQRAPDAAGKPGTWATIATVPQPANDPVEGPAEEATFSDSGLTAATTYHYRVNVATSDPALCSATIATSEGAPASVTTKAQ